jgi:hypothetical protein
MKPLTDYQGLFNCLRPDYQVDVTSDAELPDPEHECDYCINLARFDVTFINREGDRKEKYLCEECFDDPGLWGCAVVINKREIQS